LIGTTVFKSLKRCSRTFEYGKRLYTRNKTRKYNNTHIGGVHIYVKGFVYEKNYKVYKHIGNAHVRETNVHH